jgi:hypothetical protein
MMQEKDPTQPEKYQKAKRKEELIHKRECTDQNERSKEARNEWQKRVPLE